jgi:hypothetical protein
MIKILYTLVLTHFTLMSFAQLAIIGQNAETPDELLLVALEDIPAGETYHITDNEYDSANDVFTTGEGFVSFTTNTLVEKGDVFSIKNDGAWSVEGSTNVTIGSSAGSLNFSLGNEQTYLFQTDDDTHTGVISTILGAVDTWTGNIDASIDPRINYPFSQVIDLITNERNLVFNGNRETSSLNEIMTLSNWSISAIRIDLDMTDFYGAALPVEMSYFRGSEKSYGNLLEWETVTEINNEKYVIEKSKNGRSFTAVDYILGNKNTTETSTYEYVDSQPFSGLNYYRLKQVDFNGDYDYSTTIIIENHSESKIDIYPTLVSESINVELNTDEANQVVIFDQSGKSIIHTVIDDGKNTIDLTALNGGAYYMTVYMESGPYVEKFIKQ